VFLLSRNLEDESLIQFAIAEMVDVEDSMVLKDEKAYSSY
jgi:hypothetical protein